MDKGLRIGSWGQLQGDFPLVICLELDPLNLICLIYRMESRPRRLERHTPPPLAPHRAVPWLRDHELRARHAGRDNAR
jgi:hypothetical protein